MTVRFLMIQAIGFLGTVLFFLSFQFKSNRNLFRAQLLSYCFYTVHLFLLGASTGAVSYLLNMVRSYALGSSRRFLHSRRMCLLLCLLQLGTLAVTWSGWISLLPVAANIASTIAGYTHNPGKIRLAGMLINSPLWIVYDILIGSWAGIIDELVSEGSMILSLIRFGWKNLDHTETL